MSFFTTGSIGGTWGDFELPPIIPVGGNTGAPIFGSGGVVGTINTSLPDFPDDGGGNDSPNPWSAQLPALISSGLRTIRDIWGAPAAVADYANRPQQYVPVNYQQYPTNQNPSEYGSVGVDGQGLRLGNSHIGWPIIGLGVVGLVLIQSRPFSRR